MSCLILKKPDQTRRSFSLILRSTDNNGKKVHSKYESTELETLNQNLKAGSIELWQAVKIAKSIHQTESLKLNPPKEYKFNSENEEIFDKFWTQQYSHRQLIDESSSKNGFLRALRELDKTSLMASEFEINKALAHLKGNKKRKVVSCLQSIFKFLNRKINLKSDRKEKTKIKFLSEDEFNQVIVLIDNYHVKLISKIAFYSGLRIGEIFGIEEHHLKSNYVLVEQQMDRNSSIRQTKNRIERKAFLIKEGISAIKEWINIEDKEAIRNIRASEVLSKACKQVFPKNKSKHCTIHDLRHSYAVNLVSKGVSLSLVAQSLGDSVTVAQEYYAGFVLSDEGIETIAKLLK